MDDDSVWNVFVVNLHSYDGLLLWYGIVSNVPVGNLCGFGGMFVVISVV